MNNNFIIELDDNEKYVVVLQVNLNNKMYYLLSKILLDGKSISNSFDIFLFNVIENSFEEIEDENEYSFIKTYFENKLKVEKKKINMLELVNNGINKYKVVNIDNLCFMLKKDNSNEILNLEMEFYDNLDIKINDYIFISDGLFKENNIIRFGELYTDKAEIIKVVREDRVFYLQRYYG